MIIGLERIKAGEKYQAEQNRKVERGLAEQPRSIIDNWLIAYRGHWLTAIEIAGVSLDNNLCERKIRNSIGWRKMLGGHRTKEGAKEYAIIETHRQTWKHQEKYSYNELLNFLKN